MKISMRDNADQSNESRQERLRYQPPAIVYQGKITIRAGSVLPPADFGPPSPFDFPGSD